MRRARILIAATIIMTLGAGAAYASFGEDVIGIYFDLGATVCERTTAAPFQSVTAFLIITNPSDLSGVSGWEATVSVLGGAVAPSWILAAGLDVDPSADGFQVGIGVNPQALPAGPTVLLATWTGFVMAPTDMISFVITPIPGSPSFPDSPGYASGDDAGVLIPLMPSSGYPYGAPCAIINGYGGSCGPLNDDDFAVSIAATNSFHEDVGNVAATSQSASDGYDFRDTPAPPAPPADYLRLTFPHPEWSSPFGDDFDVDKRDTYDPWNRQKVWTFRVETDAPEDPVTLTITQDFMNSYPWTYALVDHQTGETVDLFDWSGSYVYTPNPDGVNYFDLVVGHAVVPELLPLSRAMDAGWSLIGMPLEPEFNTFGHVILDDDVGTSYVMSHQPTVGYGMMNSSDPVEQGRGYWVGTSAPFTWSMSGAKDLGDIPVPLNEGWTLVGYPLWFPSELNGVRVLHGANEYSWGNAVYLGFVNAQVYGYDTAAGAYISDTTLATWHGYWFQAYVPDVTLQFNYQNMPTTTLKTWQPYADLANEDNWKLDVFLQGASAGITLGTCVLAADDFDAYQDRASAPAKPGSTAGTQIYFDRPDWNLPTGDKMAQDIRAPLGAEPQQWDAIVVAPPGPATLTWDPSVWGGARDLELYLPTQNRTVVTSMRATTQVVLEIGDEPLAIRFRTPDAATGVDEGLPTKATLTARPNPFNPQTELFFTSPQAGTATIRIHDVLGRLVTTLQAGDLPAGDQGRVTWRGRDASGREVSSGTYFAALAVDGRGVGEIRKLSLVR